MKNRSRKRNSRCITLLVAVLFLWIGSAGISTAVFAANAEHEGEITALADERNESTSTDAPTQSPATDSGEEEKDAGGGVAIPREIVLGIFVAAAVGGALAGYYFTRRKR